MALRLGRTQIGLLIAWPLFIFLVGTKKPYQSKTQDRVSSPELELTGINGQRKNPENEGSFLSIEGTRIKPLVAVLVSSLPRSGSTVIGQLMQTMDQNSVYFFEPLWIIHKTMCMENKECVNNHVKSLFTCSFCGSFEYLLKTSGFLREPYFAKSKKLKENVQDKLDARQLCLVSTTRVLKFIRARLSSMEDYLNLDEYDVKIIHLTRDPRATLKSVKSFGWIYDPKFRCGEVKSDIEAFEKLVSQYPFNIFHVQYEQFCLNPEKIVKHIYKFLYGSDILPASTQEYLKTHMTQEKAGAISTQKNSTAHFQLWRKSIPSSLLKSIESQPDCKYVIDWMGHNLLETDVNARNENISLFKIV